MSRSFDTSANSSASANVDTTQTRGPQKGKGRKFFQQLQPTFSVDVPRATIKLQFLDENDPAKDTIVRKKAREWVNKNREITNQGRKQTRTKRESATPKEETRKEEQQLVRRPSYDAVLLSDPLQGVASGSIDPFCIFPNIGRKYDHIIEWFFTSTCPEEIPCSDDKYAATASQSQLIKFSGENTVLGNMAKSEVAFVLWLEEVHWYYNKALKALQDTVQKETESGVYSNDLLNSLACITATANFSGMFQAAILHRDALVRVLSIRGRGDILKGIYTTPRWTRKAIQWCEVMVAAQLIEMPKIPYFHPYEPEPIPEDVTIRAEVMTANTLANLPPVSEQFQEALRLLHLLGACYANQKPGKKIDEYVLQPLYDSEYAVLQILTSHEESQCLSDIEVLLANSLQLYIWTGPRSLPPITRLCDLFISRIMKALLPLLLEKVPDTVEGTPMMARGYIPTDPEAAQFIAKKLHHPRATNNVIAWSLGLGTIISAALQRPEHHWFKGHFHLYIQAMDLDRSEQTYLEFLKFFPTTDGWPSISLKALFRHLPPPKISEDD